MPYPHDFLAQEPADARAALMAKIPSPYRDGVARSRYLQAERPKPYRVRVRPKRPLIVQCRKSRRVVLGWGAFLKDETLRSAEGKVVRVTEGPCPTRGSRSRFSCVKQEPSDDCDLPLWKESSTRGQRECNSDRDDRTRDDSMPLWVDPTGIQAALQRRRNALPTSLDSGYHDCEMPDRDSGAFRTDVVPQSKYLPTSRDVHWIEGMSDYSCVKAADEMFIMFIDENCMEE